MNLDDNTTKIIGYVAAIIIAIVSGSMIAIKINKSKKNSSKQSDITQTGDGNKVTGGDDKSTTTINK